MKLFSQWMQVSKEAKETDHRVELADLTGKDQKAVSLEGNAKGIWKRTFTILTAFQIPWWLYVLSAGLGIISTKVAMLYIPYYTKIQMGQFMEGDVLQQYVLLLLLSTMLEIVTRIPRFYAAAIVQRNAQKKMIKKALRMPMHQYEKDATFMMGWVTEDNFYINGFIEVIVGFITGIATTVMSLEAISGINSSFLVIVPVILVYILISAWMEGKMLFLRQRRGKTANASLTAYMSEHLSFAASIRQHNTLKEELERGKKAIREYYRSEIYSANLSLLNNLVSGSITDVLTILVFLIGVPLARSGQISLTELATFQSYILIAYSAISAFPGLYTNIMYYNGNLFYVGKMLSAKEEPLKRDYSMDREDEDLHFDHVSFAYDAQTPVIRDASFTIPKGKVTMLAGPNGSGKTTIFKLIERFYIPDQGKILFGAKDAETFHLDEWRQSMAYVLQEPQLFDGSIRDNITYGMSREVSDEEVRSAAVLAGADEFILEFPEGYDYQIGDNGSKLSAGQRQRIAIARAMMLDPAYLLLDEATCNMDVLSERSVTDGILKLMEGRTTVMISHDMKMLDYADHVVVIKDGQIEVEAPREEAIRSSATLQKLIEVSLGKEGTESTEGIESTEGEVE